MPQGRRSRSFLRAVPWRHDLASRGRGPYFIHGDCANVSALQRLPQRRSDASATSGHDLARIVCDHGVEDLQPAAQEKEIDLSIEDDEPVEVA